MALTKDFKDRVAKRAQEDPEFREELLSEAMDSLFAGEIAVGKEILRDYINATIGFQELGRELDKSPKSLMRMLSPEGNPYASNLLAVIKFLQDREGVRFSTQIERYAAAE